MAVSLSISITVGGQIVAENSTDVIVKVNASWTGGSYNLLEKSGWCKIDGTTYNFTSPFNTGRTTSGSVTIFSKGVNIKHASDGTKTLAVSASYTTGVSSGTITASASKVLTTIPRKSTLTVANGTLGTKQTLKITEQASIFKHKLKYSCGSVSGFILGASDSFSTSNSVDWTPPLTLAKQNTTGTSVSVKFTLYTYTSSGSSVGSNSYTKTFSIPASVKPTCSIAVSDLEGYFAKHDCYLKGLSRVSIKVTAAGSQGSTIKTYKTSADGSNYTKATIETDALSGTGSLKITSTVTDSRNRTATATETILSVAYAAPKITKLNVIRCDANGKSGSSGDYLAAVFSSSITELPKNGIASYSIRYKKTTDANYTTVALDDYANNYAVSNGTFIFAADKASSYDVILTVTDAISSVSKAAVGSSEKRLWSILSKGLGFAFGKVAELKEVLDVDWDILARKRVVCANDKAIWGIDTDGTEYNALIPVTASGNTSLGHGLYKAEKGHTHIYGNDVQFYTNEGIYTNGNIVVMDNNTSIMGYSPSGVRKRAFMAQSENGNTVVGYDNYMNKDGNTNIYGYDIVHFVSSIGEPGSYRPYRRKGDVLEVSIRTAGFVTNSGTEVHFFVPFSEPMVGSPTVTAASTTGLILRQGTKYTHGSAASTSVSPKNYTTSRMMHHGVVVVAVFENNTNVTNNDAIGVTWNGTLTLS